MKVRSAIETNVLIAFAVAVLVVALLEALTWKVSRDAVDAALRVSHTREVLDALANAESNVYQNESSARVFIITGDATRLAERDEAISSLETMLGRIKELTADNPSQRERWTRLREAADARLASAARSVLLREAEGFEAARAYLASPALRETRRRVIDLLHEMKDEERRLLQAREIEQKKLRDFAVTSGAAAVLVLVALLSATYVLIRRQMTERKRAEAALRESEENLSTTLHSIGDAVLATDTEGRVTRMNPVAERLTGWPFAEAQGRRVDEVFRIINEQTRAPAVVPVAKVLATGEIQGLANHTVLIARDGTERPVADSAAPIRDAARRVSGVVLVFRDVTDERRAERVIREQNELLEQRVRERTAQLRESEERLNFALQTSHTGGWDLDLVDHTAHRTLEHDRIFGYGSLLPQWTYEMFLEHVLPEDRAEVDRRFREATAAHTEWRFECRIRRVDGEVRWILAAGEHQRDEAGQVRRMAGIVQDITERKHALEELQRQRAFLRQVIDLDRNFIFAKDRDGRFTLVNQAVADAYGIAVEGLIGKTDHDFNPNREEVEHFRQDDLQVMDSLTEKFVPEEQITDASGKVRWLQTAKRPIVGPDGRAVMVLGVATDITERKHAEQEIRDLNASLERRVAERTQQLEEANRAKSDFLANMSHELRTPLNSIIGFSEMLKDGLLGDLDKKQRAFVTDIFDAGTHLLSLINDILDLSKVEAGMLQLEPGAVDVAALLKASTLVVRERAVAHRIRLDTRLDPGLGSMHGDERKLKQIVYNLLSNAVKFTPDGGTVTLHARRCASAEVALDGTLPGRLITLPPGEHGEFLAITVEDTGEGIAEEHLPKLFEPFTQVDSSTARRLAGTGLGLSLVRRLAELHGGTVGVASRPGAGSRFSVWLPYREAAPAVQQGGAAPEGTAPSVPAVPLALVIEDDDRMAELIAAQLHAEGFEVMRAATGEEGLVRAAKRKPQLITLDIFLPMMDGWEFLRRLRVDPKLADTPVVIITVSEDREHGLALGARRVLQKPFVRKDLIAALAGLVDARPDGAPARVLVVDDNVKAVELLATALEAEGYRVVRAYGGAEAIKAARRAPPDLVILDLMMPEVSGFEVARALRESEHTARIPILVLTAKDLTAEDHARLNGDVSVILAKATFSSSELLAELRRAIDSRAKG